MLHPSLREIPWKTMRWPSDIKQGHTGTSALEHAEKNRAGWVMPRAWIKRDNPHNVYPTIGVLSECFLRVFCTLAKVDILPDLKFGDFISRRPLRPKGSMPFGRRSRCIPSLKRRVLANRLPGQTKKIYWYYRRHCTWTPILEALLAFIVLTRGIKAIGAHP